MRDLNAVSNVAPCTWIDAKAPLMSSSVSPTACRRSSFLRSASPAAPLPQSNRSASQCVGLGGAWNVLRGRDMAWVWHYDVSSMPWHCPVCGTTIHHHSTADAAAGRVYRCHVCRTELIRDSRSGLLVPADGPPPVDDLDAKK